MNHVKYFIFALCFSLLFISCSEGNPAGAGNNNSGSGNIAITVSGGTNPQYSWSGGMVLNVTVVRTSIPSVPIWNIVAPGVDNISAPVTHGTTPNGATQTVSTETTLSGGVQYRVTVTRINSSDFGFRDFTP